MKRQCITFTRLHDAQKAYQKGQILFAADVTESGFKQYCIFESYEGYMKEYTNRMNQKKGNHFYEVINGPQKIYLDIDIKGDCDAVEGLNQIEKVIMEQYPDAQINIYTSGEKSYHIIVNGYLVEDAEDNKKRVIEIAYRVTHPIGGFIDLKVYKKNQLFRLLQCSKKGKDNIKVLLRGINTLMSSLVCEV